jgi:hypothetical protein
MLPPIEIGFSQLQHRDPRGIQSDIEAAGAHEGDFARHYRDALGFDVSVLLQKEPSVIRRRND